MKNPNTPQRKGDAKCDSTIIQISFFLNAKMMCPRQTDFNFGTRLQAEECTNMIDEITCQSSFFDQKGQNEKQTK